MPSCLWPVLQNAAHRLGHTWLPDAEWSTREWRAISKKEFIRPQKLVCFIVTNQDPLNDILENTKIRRDDPEDNPFAVLHLLLIFNFIPQYIDRPFSQLIMKH